uniref:Uncharacterized protein n=1 Tax=Pseudomonas sp. GLE121 TaxID=1329969 RepID=R4L7G3_9PSED|nr:hypothetical protein [Pseudomonas sp. GLE121]AGL12843.1 hypothetical protein [Pseudomonas sp. GLE121]
MFLEIMAVLILLALVAPFFTRKLLAWGAGAVLIGVMFAGFVVLWAACWLVIMEWFPNIAPQYRAPWGAIVVAIPAFGVACSVVVGIRYAFTDLVPDTKKALQNFKDQGGFRSPVIRGFAILGAIVSLSVALIWALNTYVPSVLSFIGMVVGCLFAACLVFAVLYILYQWLKDIVGLFFPKQGEPESALRSFFRYRKPPSE